MPKGEEFKTLYNARFSSGGTLQNDIVPNHVDQIMVLLDAADSDKNMLIPLRNKLRTLYIIYKKGFQNAEKIKGLFKECDQLILDWKQNDPNAMPDALSDKLLELAEELFFQWNSSGAGIVFEAYDANRDSKIYNTIIGKPTT